MYTNSILNKHFILFIEVRKRRLDKCTKKFVKYLFCKALL